MKLNILSYSTQCKLALQQTTPIAVRSKACTYKSRLWIVFYIEKIIATQMHVTLFVIRVYACCVNDYIDLRSGRVIFVVTKASFEVVKATKQPAVTHVINFKLNKCMSAFSIDDIVISLSQWSYQ